MFEQPDVPANPCAAIDPSEASLKQLAQQPDDGPFAMLNLLEFAPDGGRERYARYAEASGSALRERGGELLYLGAALPELPAAARASWDAVAFVRYPSRAAYLDLQQDPAYRAALPDRRAGLARRLLYATRPGGAMAGLRDDSFPLERVESRDSDEIFVINLLRFRGPEGFADYSRYGQVIGPEIQRRGGGPRLLVEGELPLVSDGFWHDVILVHYPRLDSLMTMVASPEWQAANVHRERGLHETIAFPTRPMSLSG